MQTQNPKQSRWQPMSSSASVPAASSPWMLPSVQQVQMSTAIHPSFSNERLPPPNAPAHLSQQQIELIKQVAQLRQQANALESQAQQQRVSNETTIKQSLDNLKAHWDSLQIARQTAVDEGIRAALLERLRDIAARHGLRMEEFEQRVQAVIDTCTKEAIQVFFKFY